MNDVNDVPYSSLGDLGPDGSRHMRNLRVGYSCPKHMIYHSDLTLSSLAQSN